MTRILLVTAVAAERDAIPREVNALIVAGGVGRTNAAAVTTETIIKRGPFDAVLSVGVAGVLPGGGLDVGQPVLASTCVYAEEGMIGPLGFAGISGLGFSLGDFEGNAVPVDRNLLETLGGSFAVGPIATVATCSGTDAAAEAIARRTGAVAEAMEGAAVVHAARRLHTAAIELRVISNSTGDRDRQQWDLAAGLKMLGAAVSDAVRLLT